MITHSLLVIGLGSICTTIGQTATLTYWWLWDEWWWMLNRNSVLSLTFCWPWDQMWLDYLGKTGSVTHILLIMGLDYVTEKMKCHFQASPSCGWMRCESPTKCSLTFCWPWDEMGCHNCGKNTMLLTFCWSWDELWWECTPKQRCSITHPLLVMGVRMPKGNKSNITHSLLMMNLHNKENCVSLTSCLSCNVMKLIGKNTWSLTLYKMNSINVSSKGKAQSWCPLTFCWSWDEMWWYFLWEKFTHFLLVMEWDLVRPFERWEIQSNLHTVVHVKRFQIT